MTLRAVRRYRLVFCIVFLATIAFDLTESDGDVDCHRVCERFRGREDDYFSCMFGCARALDETRDANEQATSLSVERFEKFPFPPPRPRMKSGGVEGGRDAFVLAEMNHYCFGGKRDFCSDDVPFRVLVAGGGTGEDTLRFVSEFASMRAASWEIVHLDRSHTAILEAEARINASKHSFSQRQRVRFVHGSLLEVTKERLGVFDLVHVTGVLHHLTDPTAGMRALSSILKPNGCVHGMVYGAIGRTGIYEVQRALRSIAPPATESWERRLSVARTLLHALPPSNWLRMDDVRWAVLMQNESAHDIFRNDALFADLFLPAVDRPFSVGDVESMLLRSDMELVGFYQPAVYDPTLHLQQLVGSAEGTVEQAMLQMIEQMSYIERSALAEQIGGNIQQHWWYARKHGSDLRAASMSDLALIPILVGRDSAGGASLARTIRGNGGRLTWRYQSMTYDFEFSKVMLLILEEIDSRRSIQTIFSELLLLGSPTVSELAEGWAMLFMRLNGIHHLFLSSTPIARGGGDGRCEADGCRADTVRSFDYCV